MPSLTPKLSILIPSLPSRFQSFFLPLYDRIAAQVNDSDVEILALIDNKKRSVGLKRDSLVQCARGEYISFVDDDDDIYDTYVSSILDAIQNHSGIDVIVFRQHASINDQNLFTVDFSIEYQNEEAHQNEQGIWQDLKRRPFPCCVWKREIAQSERFPDASYGEDWHWANRCLAKVSTEYRIDKHLHIYRFRQSVTEAALDFA